MVVMVSVGVGGIDGKFCIFFKFVKFLFGGLVGMGVIVFV